MPLHRNNGVNGRLQYGQYRPPRCSLTLLYQLNCWALCSGVQHKPREPSSGLISQWAEENFNCIINTYAPQGSLLTCSAELVNCSHRKCKYQHWWETQRAQQAGGSRFKLTRRFSSLIWDACDISQSKGCSALLSAQKGEPITPRGVEVSSDRPRSAKTLWRVES